MVSYLDGDFQASPRVLEARPVAHWPHVRAHRASYGALFAAVGDVVGGATVALPNVVRATMAVVARLTRLALAARLALPRRRPVAELACRLAMAGDRRSATVKKVIGPHEPLGIDYY